MRLAQKVCITGMNPVSKGMDRMYGDRMYGSQVWIVCATWSLIRIFCVGWQTFNKYQKASQCRHSHFTFPAAVKENTLLVVDMPRQLAQDYLRCFRIRVI